MKNKAYRLLTILPLVFCACSSSNSDEPTPTPKPDVPTSTAIPISISTTMVELNATRANDYAFEKGDRVGLYVVSHHADGTTAELKSSGNHVDNMGFTYNSTWTPDTPIYWQDSTTQADFYLYYPYTASISNVEAMPFAVKKDQSTETNFKASDVLVGITRDVLPTSSAVSIKAKHVLSQILITLVAGNGFTDESLAASNVSVRINNLQMQANINLATGEPTAAGNVSALIPYLVDGSYKAMIVPQTVDEGNLITVTVDGIEYQLQKAFTFKSGTRHKFTVTLSKTTSGINVDITKWEDDNIDNGGTAE